jgi:hypothetical protein
MRRLSGLSAIVVALGLALPLKAQTPDMTGGTIMERSLGSLVDDSERIVVLQVDKVDWKKETVTFKQVTFLKGNKEDSLIVHDIGGLFDDLRRKEDLDWAKRGAKAICFFGSKTSAWICLGNKWYFAAGNYPEWLTASTQSELGVAYLGSVEKLADHVVDILAGKEVTVTAQVPGHDDRSLYDETPIRRDWSWGQKGRIWRIKASLKIQDVEDRATEKPDHIVGWGVADFKEAPFLIKSLKAKDPHVRAEAAEDLGWIRPVPASAVPALLKALEDPDTHVRIYAAGSLSRLQPDNKDWLPVLIAGLDNKDEMIRGAAAASLSNLGPARESRVPALMSLLQNDKSEYVRSVAAYALGQIGSSLTKGEEKRAVALAALVKALEQDKGEKVRMWAIRSLQKFGPDAKETIPALKKALSDKKYRGLENR